MDGSPQLEFAKRLGGRIGAGDILQDLLDGKDAAAISAERHVPLSKAAGVHSFYDQKERIPRICDGTACHFAGSAQLKESLKGLGQVGEVRCLGYCFDAPAVRIEDAVFSAGDRGLLRAATEQLSWPSPNEATVKPIPRCTLVEEPVVLRNLVGRRRDRDEFKFPDGETILAAVESSGLRGRGGAAFPTAAKWTVARDTPARDRYVVANGDSGDPGSYVDRLLMEEDPDAILAGMVACARAINARHGIVYIRAEYPAAQVTMRSAIQRLKEAGKLDPEFNVKVVSGAGSYVCGEESAMLASIEGLRGEPRPKPPYPAEKGLYGLPTVVQNVETLAIIPWIISRRRAAKTKAVSVSGAVQRPGVVEVELGIPIRRIIEDGCGGFILGRAPKMALIGGPLGRVLPTDSFDTPLSFDALTGMGHAGIVVLDETVTPRALAEHLFAFARAESCGNCTPCRIGTSVLGEIRDGASMERLLRTMEIGSLCGFGSGVPRPIRDLIAHFGDEVFQ